MYPVPLAGLFGESRAKTVTSCGERVPIDGFGPEKESTDWRLPFGFLETEEEGECVFGYCGSASAYQVAPEFYLQCHSLYSVSAGSLWGQFHVYRCTFEYGVVAATRVLFSVRAAFPRKEKKRGPSIGATPSLPHSISAWSDDDYARSDLLV